MSRPTPAGLTPDAAGAPPSYVLTTSCRDTIGIVAAITGFLAAHRQLITEAQHFNDGETSMSFMRTVFHAHDTAAPNASALASRFATEVAVRFGMEWNLREATRRIRVVVAVSRHGHCLNSLLHRCSTGSLPIEIAAVVSNHQDLRSLAEWHGVPYHYFPIATDRRREQEQRVIRLFETEDAELLVLARYMQILSDETCRYFGGRAINIHHSFLPGFKGARAYEQAHQRGVKLIGATAHYATTDLDEGPIIEQEVQRVDHTMSAPDLVDAGRDLESLVLLRAVRWHAEQRVFLSGQRTVVLR